MARIDPNNNKNGKSPAKNLSYSFPEAERITIDKASLQLQLDTFKKAIVGAFSLGFLTELLITAIALWLPLFTSDFKSIYGMSGLEFRAGYLFVCITISIYLLCRFLGKVFSSIGDKKNNRNADPEKMSKIILSMCSKK